MPAASDSADCGPRAGAEETAPERTIGGSAEAAAAISSPATIRPGIAARFLIVFSAISIGQRGPYTRSLRRPDDAVPPERPTRGTSMRAVCSRDAVAKMRPEVRP